MKIMIPQLNRKAIGGGWSFISNFYNEAKKWAEFVDDPMKADIYFIAGATQAEKYEPEKAKANGAKVVLRIDNALKNSNNRNTGMQRMKKFAEIADLVIYQSKWAKDYLEPFTKKDGPVILNGVNQEIFRPNPNKFNGDKTIYLYSRSGRDDQKGWHRAWYEYQMIQRKNPNAILWIVGKFSPDNIEYNFDFFMNEQYLFSGYKETAQEMAQVYQDTDYLLFTFYNDACSNTLIEALSSGVKLVNTFELTTGGTPEILRKFYNDGVKYFSAKRMTDEYKKELNELL